jgi:translation elongation factor EF-4
MGTPDREPITRRLWVSLATSRKGKARMQEYGSVSIPQEAFIAALRMGEE